MPYRPSGDWYDDADLQPETGLALPRRVKWSAGFRWSIHARAWLGYFAPLPHGRALLRYEQTFKDCSPGLAAQAIRAFCTARSITLTSVVLQPDLFAKPGELGEYPAETFRRAGLPVRPGHTDRVAGWTRLRAWLDVSSATDPPSAALVIHPSCTHFLRTVPTLIADPTDPDDLEETPDEYPAMGAALWAMARPGPWTPVPEELPPGAIGHWVNELREAAERGD